MVASGAWSEDVPARVKTFMQETCYDCHDEDVQKGDLDLTALSFDLTDPATYRKWVLIHDRVASGEMPSARVSPYVSNRLDNVGASATASVRISTFT